MTEERRVMERHFETELGDLKNNLIEMGSLVDTQLANACEALFGGQKDLIRDVIEGDARVDAFDTKIDRQCQALLALTQPVAIDLRLLMAGLQINTQLERIGDIAVNLAERASALNPFLSFVHQTRLEEMAQIARIMVRDSLDAFINANPGQASRVLASDDVVDKLGWEIFGSVVSAMREDRTLIDPGAHMVVLTHHIERLADHATNIAEDVIFLVEARLVKHNADASQE
ncbi:MAG TPA: phosphate signaling complex protein PhoU [Bacteroidota bacterium]|nr:phosphate signaling complex protein PhoU [Bacteroidota bacterium]